MNRTHRSVLAAGLVYLYLPIAVLCLFAFSEDEVVSFPITGLTLDWFRALASNETFLEGLLTSRGIAAPVGLIAACLGLLAGMASRDASAGGARPRWVVPFLLLLLIPFLTPKTVIGVSHAMVLSELGLKRGPLALGFAQVLVVLPFATALITASLLQIDRRLEDAARDLGASPWVAFRWVLFPLIKGPFVAAMSVGVILSLADLTLADYLSGRAQPLAKVVASEFMRELKPDLNAVQVVMLSVTALFVIIGEWLRSRSGPTQG